MISGGLSPPSSLAPIFTALRSTRRHFGLSLRSFARSKYYPPPTHTLCANTLSTGFNPYGFPPTRLRLAFSELRISLEKPRGDSPFMPSKKGLLILFPPRLYCVRIYPRYKENPNVLGKTLNMGKELNTPKKVKVVQPGQNWGPKPVIES